jgi:choline transport protein
MSTLSWQAGTAGASFILGVLIQSCIIAYNPHYTPKRWQGTLFVFLSAAIQGLVNGFFSAQLPRLQKIMVVPHGLGCKNSRTVNRR